MTRMMTAMAAITLAMGLAACSEQVSENAAASATQEASLAGTWKIDPASTEYENANENYVLIDGQYTCNNCLPPYTVPADGAWHAIERPGYDALKTTIVDERTVGWAIRKGDKQLGEGTMTVSEDGQTATVEWTNTSGAEIVKSSYTQQRVAAGPDGAHAISGEWAFGETDEISDAGLTFSFAIDGDTVTYSGNGETYSAQLGGDPVAVKGDPAEGMIKIEKTGDNSYRNTYMRDGETVGVLDLTVEGDAISGVSTDPRNNSVTRWKAMRQQG